ncbi:muscle LIM protein Mlp84B-like isoform X2 [Amphibalanus amphitrite]|uniref:muscle LIM protein Mlp84B-like isoform X2 n=1 Tax=Amphibalanus amphitrite TaxID=1232801 RepID=UPI001C918D55|nr:muscle LIM protein Mlp84B-like isoform X2 [Amphibalanus amphitrite]
MPFVPKMGDQAKCPVCDRAVYAAEERVSGGHKYHKTCFKCSMCNKGLDSTNCANHQTELYCKLCHGRRYGPKGYGFGGGAGALSMDSGEQFGNKQSASNNYHYPQLQKIAQAPPGEGCPRCGGRVYQAEEMLAMGKSWHKSCFKCVACQHWLDSTTRHDGPDGELYCKLCYNRRFGPKGYGYGGGAGALQMTLTDGVDGEVMTNKPTVNIQASIQAPPGQGCPRCGGAVYEAEKKQSRFRDYHKTCFNCKECSRILDSTNACDGPDKDIYCKLCYSKKFGPKGYGFGGGAAFLQSDTIESNMPSQDWTRTDTTTIKASPGQGCPRCGGAVFAAEMMLSKGREWHKSCFNCRDCKRPLDSTIACDGPDKDIYCKTCYARRFGPKGFGFGHAPTLVSGSVEEQAPGAGMIQPSMGSKAPPGEGCPRCGFAVYAAEAIPVRDRNYHKKCFNCKECSKNMDSTNACNGPDLEIHCRTCYGKLFGPKGVGFGMGAGVLSMG